MLKFNKAIKQLVNSIIKRDYINIDIVDNDDSIQLILPEMIPNFKTYLRKEKELI
jgi:hypothetical protein